eukprot:gnl/TRDRNA2_/TRDRNA2_81401_c0_seq1.p1 gnl/TRDRNA2_/TRDRNA2_81401_c0~~gnl/TRDRNA2_/TRDRNA2_81401_c0_seq1.p1  ORF type:complete len:202 (-),score=48.56 gnl/TRDRNA2_/TRDRNA2_81401_c0_seq1:30-635(-)
MGRARGRRSKKPKPKKKYNYAKTILPKLVEKPGKEKQVAFESVKNDLKVFVEVWWENCKRSKNTTINRVNPGYETTEFLEPNELYRLWVKYKPTNATEAVIAGREKTTDEHESFCHMKVSEIIADEDEDEEEGQDEEKDEDDDDDDADEELHQSELSGSFIEYLVLGLLAVLAGMLAVTSVRKLHSLQLSVLRSSDPLLRT